MCGPVWWCLAEGAAEIVPGIYAGGTKAASEEIMWGRIKDLDFRFFAGVHAWRPGQLQQEMDQGAWVSDLFAWQ